jgi:hypothetical protein
MEKPYESTISMPVQYSNLPKNKTLINPPPSHLDVRVRAQGFNLLRHKFGITFDPINFNVSLLSTSTHDTEKNNGTYIITNRFISQLSNQFGNDLTILNISPDTLFFHFDNVSKKTVPVIANLELGFENQFFQSDSIKLIPAQVTIKGPSAIVDLISSLETRNQVISKLSKSTKRTLELVPVDEISFSTSKISVEIPVSQFTEYLEKASLIQVNVPDNINLITFPGKVQLSCLMSLEQYKNISKSGFILGVDYNDISANSNLLPVKILNQPSFIRSLVIEPEKVEFIIEKK